MDFSRAEWALTAAMGKSTGAIESVGQEGKSMELSL